MPLPTRPPRPQPRALLSLGLRVRVALRSALALGMLAAGAAPVTCAARAAETPASLRTLLDLAAPEAVDPDLTFTDLESLLAAGLPSTGDALSDGATLPEASPEALEPLRRFSCGSAVLSAAARLANQPGHADVALLVMGPRLSAARQLGSSVIRRVGRLFTYSETAA